MPLQVDWHGVYPALPTQFHDDLSLDIESTQKHVQVMLDNGIHGLIMLGTIGENCSLTREEKIKVLKYKNKGRVRRNLLKTLHS